MASTATYLNFNGKTEEAFEFYRAVFGGDYAADGISRFGDAPPMPGAPPLSDAEKNLIMNVGLTITGDHLLMGSDVLESMGSVVQGNGNYICLCPDTKAEADRLFNELSAGGEIEMPMADMFWGDYFGSFKDKFGVC